MSELQNPDLFEEGLLRSAKRTEFFQSDIGALSEILPESDEELVALLERQSGLLEAEIFSNLWVAALWAGRKVPGRLLREGAQFFPDIGFLLATTPLCEGAEETCEALVDAVESGHLGSERELVSLICAARRLEQEHEGDPEALVFPERLLFLARKQARKFERFYLDEYEMFQEMLLSILANLLKDENLWRVLEDHGIESSGKNEELGRRFFKGFCSLEDFVPRQRPERVISGYQVRRAVPKLSRNAPCPCGSGKKYKKCCFAKDQKKLSQSSDVAGVTVDELEKERESRLTPGSVRDLRYYEVMRLKPEKLGEDVLRHVAQRLMVFDELDHVFILREESRFADSPSWETVFEDVLFRSIQKKRVDLVDRVLAIFPALEDGCRTELAIMKGREEPVEFLEALENRCRELLLAEDAERDGNDTDEMSRQLRAEWAQLGFDLLGGGFPHLGIATARGWLTIINEYETDYFLEAIEEKRDELGLQPFDVSEELAKLSENLGEDRFRREMERRAEKRAFEDLESRNADLEARERELSRLRKELGQIKQNADRTEKEAAKRIADLERERELARESGEGNSGHDAEIAELREKIGRLKGEVKRKHEQRNELRRDLRKVRSEMVDRDRSGGSAPKTADDPAASAEERLLADFDHGSEGVQPPRVPVFPDGFLGKKKGVPDGVLQAAMQLVGRLAAGEPAAFQGVKRLKLRRGILRQKVAGSYRLLFSIERDELKIVDLINRRDLEKWLSD